MPHDQSGTRRNGREVVAARLAAAEGLPGGWRTAGAGPARVFTFSTTAELHIYGPPGALTADGYFDPASVTNGTPFLMGAVIAPGLGRRLASETKGLGARLQVVETDDYDLVVASAESMAEADVDRFLSSVTADG